MHAWPNNNHIIASYVIPSYVLTNGTYNKLNSYSLKH